LNTRRIVVPAPAGMTELEQSLYHYGLPDITSASSESTDTRNWLRRQVEETIRVFEPRLTDVHVSVEAVGDLARREVRFVSEALLNVVYPHYLHPIPSMSIVELRLDPEQGKLTTGLPVARGAPLYSKPVGGTPCKFRTCYDTTLWPVTVAAAQWRAPDQLQPPVTGPTAVGALRLELECLPDVSFAKLALNQLRLHLNGESTLISTLYE